MSTTTKPDALTEVIDNPWVLVHELKNGQMETILTVPTGTNYEQYGIVIADIIRHVAKAYDVDEADVLAWVHREMDHPSTEIKRKLQS